jgi:hypothetical protein
MLPLNQNTAPHNSSSKNLYANRKSAFLRFILYTLESGSYDVQGEHVVARVSRGFTTDTVRVGVEMLTTCSRSRRSDRCPVRSLR